MELWNHWENPYPFVPNEVLEQAESVRASLPNKYCDPKIVARLYDEILDEYRLCDDIGLHIVTNEHHSGINNLWAASPVITGVVANITKNVRILSLGTLITVRPDPVRIAEEYATIDILSKGRLEIGFVKSGATEMVSGDANPMRLREREWEAIDLIEKTLTTQDGPFCWEGKFFTHPHVNIWPRPYQQPRPDFWAATAICRPVPSSVAAASSTRCCSAATIARARPSTPTRRRACRPECRRPARTVSPTWPLPMSATPTKKRCASARRSRGSSR